MKGVISAGHELTARAGVEMLRAGGNAFDAAVAASFASFVCESALTSPAGGGFCMAHTAKGTTTLYDFFTDVPGKGRNQAKEDLSFFSVYIDFADVTQELHIGEGSAAVPGTMAGLAEVHKNHCTMPIKTLLQPAITYAREGIELNAWQAYFNSLLSPMLGISERTRSVYAPNGKSLNKGGTIYNKDMADTFEHLAEQGLARFYDGDVGGAILDCFGPPGGLITDEDLRSYRVQIRRPLELTYRSRQIFTNPPPSSGGCLIAFSLKLLDAFDVGAMGHNSIPFLRLLSDVMGVTDEARRDDFDHRVYEEGMAERFLSGERVGHYVKRLVAGGAGGGGVGGDVNVGNTTQISVIDNDDNAAAITTSIGIGCGFMIPGTGIMMNNMLGEDDLNPHGFHKQSAGVRMSSMMAPTIVMKEGVPEVVLGSGGSKRIRSAILQVILNMVDFSLPANDAVNSSRIHRDGELLHLEEGIDGNRLAGLEGQGVELKRWQKKNMFFGGVHTATSNKEKLEGAGDARRGGVVLKAT